MEELKGFIEVKSNTERRLVNIKNILQVINMKDSQFKSEIQTTGGNYILVIESYEEIKELIKKAQ